ncbi:MAG: PaaI family thioesterase [Planctomycetota bacterium]
MFDESRGKAIIERVSNIPIVKSLNIQIESFGEGFCKAIVPRQEQLDGVYRSYHGGLLTTAADSIACFAILTMTDLDEVLTTTDIHIRFLAPCLTDVVVSARVIKLGKTLCPVSVELHDTAGKLVGTSQVTYIRLDRLPAHAPQLGASPGA